MKNIKRPIIPMIRLKKKGLIMQNKDVIIEVVNIENTWNIRFV